MATVDNPRARTTAGLSPILLPMVLYAVLFCVAVPMAQVAPSRVTSGVYQVIIGDGEAAIPTEALTCERAGDTVTCTTPVGADRLTVDVVYTGAPKPGPCTARYGERSVPCLRQMGFYGHASHNLWVTDDLGLSRAQLAELNDAAPWWRKLTDLHLIALTLIGTLGVAAGVSTFLLRRRFRPAPPDRRLGSAIVVAVLAVALFTVTGLLFSPSQSSLLMVSPLSLLAAAMIGGWQWQLAGPSRGGRVMPAVVATVVVAFYTSIATLVFLIQSGFDD